MTAEQVASVLTSFDQIMEVTGQTKLTDIINAFDSKVPDGYKTAVLAQVKEDVAKAIAEGLEKSKAGLTAAMDDPTIIERLKAMGPQE